MKKTLKQCIIAIVLTIAMTVSLVPQITMAEEIEQNQGTQSSVFDSFKKIETLNNNSILGMDFSYYQQDLKWGNNHHNYKYEEVDVFDFVKSQGINTVSIRVMVNPTSGDAQYFTL